MPRSIISRTDAWSRSSARAMTRHYPLFGITEAEQWESMAERYALLRRLWDEEDVTWQGHYRPPSGEGRTFSPALCNSRSRFGTAAPPARFRPNWREIWRADFSANAFHPLAKYKALIDHYRERWVAYGHDSKDAIVGAGAGSLYVARTDEEAIKRFRPYYDAFHQTAAAQHNKSPFNDLDDNIANGPVLVGSPERVIEKILRYQAAFGNEVSEY